MLYRRHIFKLKDETRRRDAVSHRVLWCSQTRFKVEAESPGETCALSFPEEDEKDAGQRGCSRRAQTDQRLRQAAPRGLDRRVHT